MNPKLKILTAMATFGTIGIFVKYIPLPAAQIAFFRALIAALVLGGYNLAGGKKIAFKEIREELFLLFLSGAAMGFNWIFLFEAYNHTTVSLATLSYYFAPVIVTIASSFLFKERLTPKQIICFVMSTLGLVLIIGVGGESMPEGQLKGITFGLAAAALYATVILLNKSIKNIGGIDRTLLQFVASLVVMTPYVLLTGGLSLQAAGMMGIGSLLILGVVHTGITYVLYFTSLKDLRGQEVAILSYLDPLVAVVLSLVILKEGILPNQILGGLLILGFTLLNEIKSLR